MFQQFLFLLALIESIAAAPAPLAKGAFPPVKESTSLARKSTALVAQEGCPPKSVNRTTGYKSACYWYVEAPMSSTGIQDQCAKLAGFDYEGYAASSLDAFENAFIRQYLKSVVKNLKAPVWLGMTAQYVEHCSFNGCSGGEYDWQWDDNFELAWVNFGPGVDGDCDANLGVAIIPENGQWDVYNASQAYGFLCEILLN